jgi:hypothetical protein
MPTHIAPYSIELFKQDGEGIEQVIDRHADIKIARLIYQTSVKRYPGRRVWFTAVGFSFAFDAIRCISTPLCSDKCSWNEMCLY